MYIMYHCFESSLFWDELLVTETYQKSYQAIGHRDHEI